MESVRITIEKFCPVCSRKFSPEESITTCRDDGAPLLPVTTDELAGRIVDGKFMLMEVIGTGGCSTVYRAQHVPLNRLCAFKLLRSDLVSTVERIKRFEQEARVVSGLSHPNICTVYDCGILSTGQPYLVLENVEGKNLADILLEGRIAPESRALRLIKQIAAGMKAAHGQGVLHRDLKPGNVMILDTPEGEQVKIIDFGLSKALGTEGEELTATGHAIGTPAYMSPEQVRGETLDVRSDIYSFGCVVYEMLTGKRAIEGRTAFETMQNHLHGQPAHFSSGSYMVPFELRDMTLKCLEKDPLDRFQSMEELEGAIQRIQESGNHDTQSPGARATNNSRAGRKIWWFAGAAVVLIVGLTAYRAFMAPSSSSGEVKDPIATAAKIDPATAKLLDEFRALNKSGRFPAAERVALRTIALVKEQGNENSPDMVAVRQELSSFYLRSNRLTDAAQQIQAVFEIQQKLAVANSDDLLRAHKEAGEAYIKAAIADKAIEHLKQYSQLAKQKYGAQSKQYRQAVYDVASSELSTGAIGAAERHFRELADTEGVDLGPGDPHKLQALMDLCNICMKQQKMDEAQKLADQAVAALSNKTSSQLRVSVLRTAAHVAERQHDFNKAGALISQAIDASQKLGRGNDTFWMTNELLVSKGSYFRQAKNYKDAEPVLKESLQKLIITHRPESSEYQFALREYVKVLRATGRDTEADATEKARRLVP